MVPLKAAVKHAEEVNMKKSLNKAGKAAGGLHLKKGSTSAMKSHSGMKAHGKGSNSIILGKDNRGSSNLMASTK